MCSEFFSDYCFKMHSVDSNVYVLIVIISLKICNWSFYFSFYAGVTKYLNIQVAFFVFVNTRCIVCWFFCKLNIICLDVDFLWYRSCLMISELPGSVVWCLSFIWENSHPLLLQSFWFLLSFPSIPITHYTFCNCPAVLRYSVIFLSLHFPFWSPAVPLDFFLGVSLLTLPFCLCMFTFSIRILNILIIVILNSPSDYPQISVISQSVSDAFSF